MRAFIALPTSVVVTTTVLGQSVSTSITTPREAPEQFYFTFPFPFNGIRLACTGAAAPQREASQ